MNTEGGGYNKSKQADCLPTQRQPLCTGWLDLDTAGGGRWGSFVNRALSTAHSAVCVPVDSCSCCVGYGWYHLGANCASQLGVAARPRGLGSAAPRQRSLSAYCGNNGYRRR